MTASPEDSEDPPGARGPLVSVVIPAYNAEGTLRATLDSVLNQSHAALEIIVVDDGSTDATEAIARDLARLDPRLSVITTPNRGVAAARNTGTAASRADYVAPLDADDLWHPEKIARQLEVIERGGPQMGFVYTGFRTIDAEDRVMESAAMTWCEGEVFLRSVIINLVGNGSGILIRREALQAIGGYTEELRRRGVEGTEDRLVQSLIARSWRVGMVPSYLVGYRRTPSCMSADQVSMSRSRLVMLSMLETRVPDIPEWVMEAARALTEVSLARNLMRRLLVRESFSMIARAFARSPAAAAADLMDTADRFLRLSIRGMRSTSRKRMGGVGPDRDFFSFDPDDGADRRRRTHLARLVSRAADEEEAFAASRARRS